MNARANIDAATLRGRVFVNNAQREYWSNAPFQLSIQRFAIDKAAAAAIRTSRRQEYRDMDLPTLALTMKNALAQNDLPTVWVAHRAGVERSGDAGFDATTFSISGVVIPEQDAALQAIAECRAAVARVDLAVGKLSGSGLASIDKLSAGRVLAAAARAA